MRLVCLFVVAVQGCPGNLYWLTVLVHGFCVYVHVLLVVSDDRNILRLLNGTVGSSSMRVAGGCYDCLASCVTFNNVNLEF